jgi:hypothetical protein
MKGTRWKVTLDELRAMECPTISTGVAAAVLRSDRRTVTKAVNSGVFKSVKISPRKTLILREPFIALLEGKAFGGELDGEI